MWEKLGFVFVAKGQETWMQSHAFVPTPILLADGRIRVFVAFLDAKSMGRIGWVDVDANEPTRVIGYSRRPALEIGPPGHFDDSGVTPVQAIRIDGVTYLYYNGWQRSQGVPYHIFSGLAVSADDGESFERLSTVPILERTAYGSLVRSTPFVIPPVSLGSPWRMWYCAGHESFVRQDGRWAPQYGICYAESFDGVVWPLSDEVLITPAADEFGLTRPIVDGANGHYRMLLSVRSERRQYRIEEAFSLDGKHWKRKRDSGPIDVSKDGWDSEMVAFPGVVTVPHRKLMFYNGNGNGRTGMGVARLVDR